MFDCLGGDTPPPGRNTSLNKGRKCFHCLGAPNNLIRPCPVDRGKNKGIVLQLQAWTGPEVSRMLRLTDFKTIGT